MKIRSTIFIVALSVATTGFVSCGNKTDGGATPADGDSTALDEQAAEAKDSVAPAAEQLQTPDLTLFGLKGKVKTAVIKGNRYSKDNEVLSLAYDEQGRLTKIGDYKVAYNKNESGKVTNAKGNVVKRDSQGRLLGVDCAEGCSGQRGHHFKYTKGGYEYEYDCGECTMIDNHIITLSVDGLEAKDVYSTSDIGFSYELTSLYTYTKFDDHGNWIERVVKWAEETCEYDPDGDEADAPVVKESGVLTQVRKITYYE